jgi:serine/threonine protein kinase
MIQLKKEIEVLRAVNHCNIVSYYEYFETKDSVIVVMERCKGDDLFEYILDHGPFQEDAAKEIIRQSLSAVAYLHMRGVIHRDIKAENIILCNNRYSHSLIQPLTHPLTHFLVLAKTRITT